jgi:hypothetical protein
MFFCISLSEAAPVVIVFIRGTIHDANQSPEGIGNCGLSCNRWVVACPVNVAVVFGLNSPH